MIIKEEIFTFLKEKIVEKIPTITEDAIYPTDDIKTLGLDSFDITELIIYLEDRFDVEINDELIGNLTSVEDFVNIIYNSSKWKDSAI